MRVPFHKQTDPNKQAGQVVFPIPEQFLHQYIERKTDDPKRITFDEWWEKRESDLKNLVTKGCARLIWDAGLTCGKIS